MTMQNSNDALLCKVSPSSLSGLALSWLHLMSSSFIALLKELLERLVTNYVSYTKEQHLYRILVTSAHILLTFCIRIGAFDRSHVFGLVQVFRVPCIIIIGVRVQKTNIVYCG